MSQAKITLIGMERFLNPDHSVFENLTLPEGIDKDILIGSILLRCQEFELLYSDPDFMTAAVNIWGRKNYWTFDRWVKLINKEYDPLYNKDYYEEWTDKHEGEYSREGSGSSSGNTSSSSDMTRTDNLSHSTDVTRTDDLATTNDATVTHLEKAYNSGATFVETTKDVTDQDGSQTGTVRTAGTDTDTGTVRDAGTSTGQYGNRNSSDESGDDSYENTHEYHGYGNIGITSAQELFMKETDVARWNMYEHMADLFAAEFCIMIY